MNQSFKGWIRKNMKANPQSWLSFFKKYNIPVKTQYPEVAIVKAYGNYGKELSKDLSQLLIDGRVVAWDGEKILDTTDSWLQLASTLVSGANNTEQAQSEALDDETDAENETKKETIIAVSAFIVVCVIIIIVFVRLNKKSKR